MNTLLHIDLNLYSLLILTFVFINGYSRLGWRFLRDKLFMLLVISTAACQVFDTLSWVFDGSHTAIGYAMAVASNVLLYIFGPIPSILWSYYVYVVVTGVNKIPRWSLWLFSIPLVINAGVSAMSPITHTFFFFTAGNVYQRGVAYAVGPLLSLFFVAAGLAFAWAKRQELDSKGIRTLLLFPVAPLLGGILQMVFFGLTTTWSLITISLLLTYINMQDIRLDFDYLTGVFNRRYLDRYLNNRIDTALEKPGVSGFAVAFADLDDFKIINDSYGHSEGDIALIAASNIFAKNIRSGDLVARYAGDEFVLILELHSDSDVESILDRMELAFMAYNRRCDKPYDLSVSIGYCLYDSGAEATAEQMIRLADVNMLARKHAAKALEARSS